MSVYVKIRKQLPGEVEEMLIKMGFLKSTFRRNVSIYERYLQYREHGEASTDAIVHAADDFGISDRHVFRIVKTFSEIPVN
jgi:hypothetical protein